MKYVISTEHFEGLFEFDKEAFEKYVRSFYEIYKGENAWYALKIEKIEDDTVYVKMIEN